MQESPNTEIFSSISKKLFELFVANPYAIAVQNANGAYLTKYIQYDHSILKAMLETEGSAGCYQQRLNSGLIKWICLDFDCKDKENPDIDGLNSFIKENVLTKLDKLEIKYLTEFSGRRGIHIWIIFDDFFEKKIGFQIVKSISKNLTFDTKKFGLDEFPATEFSTRNKVGKQVKFPLSKHKMGGHSFFFKNHVDLHTPSQKDFWQNQYDFLQGYEVNSIEKTCLNLGIPFSNTKQQLYFVKHSITGKESLSAKEVVSSLSKVKVFRDIFNRFKLGNPTSQDWFVILGSIGSIDKNGSILKAIFAQSPIYDEKKTQLYITHLKDRYYPATLGYLYKLYNIEIECNLNPEHTSIDILAEAYNLTIQELQPKFIDERDLINSIEATASKEKNYILINDENIPINTWNQLKNFSNYDYEYLNNLVKKIKEDKNTQTVRPHFKKYVRIESPERKRTLVSQGALDRVLTTHLAIDLAKSLSNSNSESFSYKPAFTASNDIFLNWYTSWGQYIEKIKSYIEMPFLNDWGVITLDIKHFYDNIDFLVVRDLCEKDLNETQKNELNYLINYNEKLMRDINDNGERKGVPQGPAYARIISEIFINKILQNRSTISVQSKDYQLFRYVDDIIIFYKGNVDGNILFKDMQELFEKSGLELNEEKSRLYGTIANLSEDDVNVILRKDKFNYMYKISDFNMMLTSKEKKHLFSNHNYSDFKIEDAAYIFSNKTDRLYTELYYNMHIQNICKTDLGRGSVFRKIYDYILQTDEIFTNFTQKNFFNTIPPKSLNYKNFISTLYLNVQEERINIPTFHSFCDTSLINVSESDVDVDDYEVIKALIDWRFSNV